MYGLQRVMNTRTNETFRALIRNNEPQAQTDLMIVKELVAKTAEGDVLVAEDGSVYFALQHDLGGLSARPAVRSYRLSITSISDRLTIYRRSQDTVDNFGKPVDDQLQTIAGNVKAVVENKARVKMEATPAQLVQTTTHRVLCGQCPIEKGDLVAINGSEELHHVLEVDADTWDGVLLVLTLMLA